MANEEKGYSFQIESAIINGNDVSVRASFLSDGVTVAQITHGFSKEMDAKDIKKEIKKALDLYVSELSQIKKQKKVDEKTNKENKLINNLIG